MECATMKTNVVISTHGGKFAPEKPVLSLTIRDLLNYKDIYDHVKDQIISKIQGTICISIKNNSNTIALAKIDVPPDISYLVDELLWAFRLNSSNKYCTSLCLETLGSTSSVDIVPKTYKDLFQWIRVSIEDYMEYEEKKFKFEYENKYEKWVECDMCIAALGDNYSSLKLPKTNIVEDLPEDCYTDNYRLSMLTIRMIQEEMI